MITRVRVEEKRRAHLILRSEVIMKWMCFHSMCTGYCIARQNKSERAFIWRKWEALGEDTQIMAQMALLRRTGHVGILIMLAFAFASKGVGIDQIA